MDLFEIYIGPFAQVKLGELSKSISARANFFDRSFISVVLTNQQEFYLSTNKRLCYMLTFETVVDWNMARNLLKNRIKTQLFVSTPCGRHTDVNNNFWEFVVCLRYHVVSICFALLTIAVGSERSLALT